MTKKLDILLYAGLFSGLGVFSYLLLVSYSGFSPLVQEELYSFGACLFCILAFKNKILYNDVRVKRSKLRSCLYDRVFDFETRGT